ncbi:cAMP-binding domain of CRP or a regulatory subunit of cAMP-dependent protein kinases [Paenibacillus uliginis N3/975]|uniref:cAMP-binding domain of CRP or a regulatory subunit of cAMP-dependent protein kinases n=1 Tax=Paenibacillus uliginis N3/975 TaxID=1313296 RepID=A0A1X7HD63_9BACL|nr:Crp/Fnr family transcriptional regulator [Paenibacillus uliginis]SMF83765.1 cAMP-binding domain of CRP or a regulatory subunit of cAMP-dependent protein kinases [Paenibacillus uliginis N3/975]
MKESNDREQLNLYLHAHQIQSIFPEQLLPYLTLYSYEQGERICSQGEPSEHVYVLVKGKIKVSTTSPEGKKLILSFKTPLEVVGDIEYVQGMDMINTVEAVSPVCMIVVRHHWLKKYGKEYPPLLQFLLDIITRKFCVKSNSMSFNLMYPVEVRLASYLLSVSFDESNSEFKGQLSTGSLMDAADLIGTSYRHLNRVIHQLSTKGLIERNKAFILVKDREGLQALAGHNIYE